MPTSHDPSLLLRHLFEAAGWSVEDVPAGWRAFHEKSGREVLAYLGREVPAGFQRSFHSGAKETWVLHREAPDPAGRDRVELTGAVVVAPEEIPSLIVTLLRPEGGGGREELPSELSAPEARTSSPRPESPAPPTPSPITEPETALAEHEPPAEAPAAPWGVPAREAPAWSEDEPSSSATTPEGENSPTEASTAGGVPQEPIAFPPLVFEQERIIRPRLLEPDIHQMAHGRWSGGRPRLLLVPFFLFAYSLPEDEDRTRGNAPARLVAVPAVGGPAQFWPTGEREVVSALATPHDRIAPRLREGAAQALALEAIRERHAQSEDHTEQRRGVLVIENRRLPRAEREVRMGPATVVWVPHWLVEAWNGRETLDAVTGLPAQLDLDAA